MEWERAQSAQHPMSFLGGLIQGAGVALPVAKPIAAFWWCCQQSLLETEGGREYLRVIYL